MYTGNPSDNQIDRIRVYCTDTDNCDLLVSDTEIEFFLHESNDNEKQAALKAVHNMLFKLAKQGGEKVGGVQIDNGQRIVNLKSVLNDLEFQLRELETPYAGGISNSDVNARRKRNYNPLNPLHFKDHKEYGNHGGGEYVAGTFMI